MRDRPADVVPLRTALRVWWSVAIRSFGGPAGQIAVMHTELVDKRRWIGERRFLHALSYCTVLPGPEAQQLSIYLGWLLNGTVGGLLAGILFVLPGAVVMMVLSAIYVGWGDTGAVSAVFAGVAPAVVVIVAQAVQRIGRRTLSSPALVAIAGAAFMALAVFSVPFPVVLLAAATIGVIGTRTRPRWFETRAHGSGADDAPPPLIADDALHHERPSWARAWRILAVGVVAWATPVGVAALVLGADHTIVEQGLFFSVTALVTFGGAYAVLSFVAQRAVEVYRWLMPGEMVHGLALAESTPGPLIMVVQFVGFLGAHRQPGDLDPWVSGVLGACLVVWVTFVPCFLLVFLGAPHVEAVRHNQLWSAALAGISAAVVGVIANLGLYLAMHTVFDSTRTWSILDIEVPVWATLDGWALAIGALAAALLFGRRWSVLRVLGVCAAAGAVIGLF